MKPKRRHQELHDAPAAERGEDEAWRDAGREGEGDRIGPVRRRLAAAAAVVFALDLELAAAGEAVLEAAKLAGERAPAIGERDVTGAEAMAQGQISFVAAGLVLLGIDRRRAALELLDP